MQNQTCDKLQTTKDARSVEPFRAVSAALFAWDPVRLAFGDDYEYDAEAKLIAERLSTAKDVQDVQRLVYTVFRYQFNDNTAGAIEDYDGVAARIWQEWLEINA